MGRKKKEEKNQEDLHLNLETEGEGNDEQESEEGQAEGDQEGNQESQGETPEQVIEKLKKQIADKDEEVKLERERASTAEKEQQATQKKATTAEEDALSAHETAIANALSHATSEIESLEAQYEAALEGGEAKLAVSFSKKLNQAQYKSMQLEQQQEQIKTYKENKKRELDQRHNQQQELTNAQREWIKNHPKYETDQDYKADAHAAHSAALGRGMAVGSSSYMTFIDSYLDKLYGEGEQPEPRKPPPRSATTFAAPGGRSMPSQTSEQKKPQLTPVEKQTCKEMGWDEETYLKGKKLKEERKSAR